MEDNIFIWFLFGMVLTLTVIWAIGCFITWDVTWFIHGVFNRVVAAVLFIIALTTNLKALWD